MKISEIKKLKAAAVVVMKEMFNNKKAPVHYPANLIDLFDMVRDEKMKLITKGGLSKKQFKRLMKL